MRKFLKSHRKSDKSKLANEDEFKCHLRSLVGTTSTCSPPLSSSAIEAARNSSRATRSKVSQLQWGTMKVISKSQSDLKKLSFSKSFWLQQPNLRTSWVVISSTETAPFLVLVLNRIRASPGCGCNKQRASRYVKKPWIKPCCQKLFTWSFLLISIVHLKNHCQNGNLNSSEQPWSFSRAILVTVSGRHCFRKASWRWSSGRPPALCWNQRCKPLKKVSIATASGTSNGCLESAEKALSQKIVPSQQKVPNKLRRDEETADVL